MTTAAAIQPVTPLTSTELRARVDARLRLLRAWLSHDHDDTTYWWARGTTAPKAQVERIRLRELANLLHVDVATRRGHRHGTRFKSLDEQRDWLARCELSSLPAAELAGLRYDVTLVMIREGAMS